MFYLFVFCRYLVIIEVNGNRLRGENGGNKINLDGIKMIFLIVVIFLFVMLILLGLIFFIFNKKCKKEKGNLMLLCVIFF